MKRLLKIFRVLLLLGMVLAIAGLLFWVFVLPGIVETEVERLLTDLGLGPVDLRVRGLSASHATISDISMGEDRRLKVGNVDVEFDLEGLGAVRVRKVRVTGATLEVRYEDGKIDLGPLGGIDTGESDGNGELPFDTVELSASEIVLRREGVIDRFPIDGTLQNAGGGTLRAYIRTRIFGRELRLRGDLMSLSEQLRAELDSSDVGLAFIHYDWSGPQSRLKVTMALREDDVDVDVDGLQVRANSLTMAGSFALADLEEFDKARLEIRARDIEVDGVRIGRAILRSHTLHDCLHLRAELARRAHSGLETALSVSTIAPVSLTTLLDAEAPRRFRVRLDGVLPEEIDARIRDAGLDPAAPIQVHAEGEGLFQWRAGDYEAALTLDDFRLKAGDDPLHPELLVETYHPGQVAYDASGKLRVRLPRLWTEVVTPEVCEYVDPGLLAAAGLHLVVDGSRVEASFEYETDEHLVVRAGDIEARSAWLRFSGKVVLEKGALVALNSHAEVTADRLRSPGAGLSVNGFEAEVPLLLGSVQASGGTFATGAVSWRGQRLPGISGGLAGKPGSLSMGAAWPIAAGDVQVVGGIRFNDERPAGSFTFAGTRIPVGKGDRAGRLLKEFTGLDFTGLLSFEGSLPFREATDKPSVRATFTDGTISGAEGSLSLEGVDLSLELEDFSQLRTPGRQQLLFESGKLGDFLLGKGEVLFRVDGPRRVVIEDARWELGRTATRLGRFWARPFLFDPGDPEIDTTLFCEGFDLADWLSLVAPEGTVGRGTLYGRLPFVLKTKPRLSATLGQGYLFAESGGWLGVKGTKEYVEKHIPATGPSAEYTEVVQRRIIHALENFNFEKLRFDLIEKDDGLTLRVGVMGRGAEVLVGTVGQQELDLTLNFNGVDSLIGPALDASLGVKELSKLLERSWKGGPR